MSGCEVAVIAPVGDESLLCRSVSDVFSGIEEGLSNRGVP